jgi:hypothetical protein
MPSSSQRSPTLVSGCPIAAMASRSLAAVILNGRPPFRPRARAEANPAIVRSAISSRSNSALCGEPHKADYAEPDVMQRAPLAA